MVLQHQPLQLLMAPSGVDKGQVPADQLIVVDGQGKVLTGKGKASAETVLHLRIVEATQAGAVLHTHSVPGTCYPAITKTQEGLSWRAGKC